MEFQAASNAHISPSVPEMDSSGRTKSLFRINAVLGLIVGLLVLGAIVMLAPNSNYTQNTKLTSFSAESKNLKSTFQASKSSVKVSMYNAYSLRDGAPGKEYDWLEGNLLAEPFQSTTVKIVSPNPTYDYEVTITNTVTGEEEVKESATSFQHQFNGIDDRILEVAAFESTAEGEKTLVDRLEQKVFVRYVRREIRALFDEDLEVLLDTMRTLWDVDQDDGVAKYGSQYKSIVEMHKFHLKYAGDYTCDHLHDGYGFITQHAAMTIVFEQSLQAVNPKVSLPYWDYTSDVEKHYVEKGSDDFTDFTNSELFSAKYFGSTDEETLRIADGRWADLEVPYKWDYFTEDEMETIATNVYGQLRAPWSNNADPHVVRSTKQCGADSSVYFGMPDCSTLSTLLSQSTLASYMKDISYDPHGPIHIQTGGALGCEGAYEPLAKYFPTDRDFAYFKGQSFIFHKGAYRSGVMVCNKSKGDGTCFCPDEEYWKSSTKHIALFMNQVGFASYRHYTDDFNKELITTICNSGLVEGDNLQASSSYTPEFWPIHPTVERMVQWKRIYDDFPDLTWPSGLSWLPGVSNCIGHDADDLVLLGSASIISATGEELTPTNSELLSMLSPYENSLTYIYDNLKWDYCAAVGYDMSL